MPLTRTSGVDLGSLGCPDPLFFLSPIRSRAVAGYVHNVWKAAINSIWHQTGLCSMSFSLPFTFPVQHLDVILPVPGIKLSTPFGKDPVLQSVKFPNPFNSIDA